MMEIKKLFALLAAIAFVISAGCSQQAMNKAENNEITKTSQEAIVSIRDFAFNPAVLILA